MTEHRPERIKAETYERIPQLDDSPLVREIEDLRAKLRQMAISNSRMAEEVAGAHEQARAVAKENHKLLAENRALKARQTQAENYKVIEDQIYEVIACWKEHRPRTSAAFGDPDGKAWAMIEKALKLMRKDETGPVEACCEAIEGLHLAPFESYGRRFGVDGPGRTLRWELRHALGDEMAIEKCREIRRRAYESPLDEKFRRYEVTGRVHDAHGRVLMDALREKPEKPEKPGEDVLEVDGLVVRP